MGLDNLDQNYYSKSFPGTNHPWSNTEPLQNRNQLNLEMKVYHKEVYDGKELLEVVGIRKNEVELYGDYSGMGNSYGSQWMSLDGVML